VFKINLGVCVCVCVCGVGKFVGCWVVVNLLLDELSPESKTKKKRKKEIQIVSKRLRLGKEMNGV